MKHTKIKYVVIVIFFIALICVSFAAVLALSNKNYYKRTYISEALSKANLYKNTLEEYYQKENKFPERGILIDYKVPEPKHEAIRQIKIIENGIVEITFNEKLKNNAKLLLTPNITDNKIVWTCSRQLFNEMDKYAPLVCKQ